MELSGRSFFLPFEAVWMEWLQRHMSGAGTVVISSLSMLGEELVLVLLLGFIYWSWDKRMGKYIGLNVLMAVVWNPMIKSVFLRRRPYFDHPGIRILRPVDPEADIYNISAQGYSFPSGHSANAAACYGSVAAYVNRRPEGTKRVWVIWAAASITLLVGFSRVAVGAHYPTDVLAGWALGAAIVWLMPRLQRVCRNTAVFHGLLLVLTLPGLLYCRSADYFTGLGLLAGFIAGNGFEERFVRFENTRAPLRAVLRVAGGLAVFLILNKALKLPFSGEFLDSGTYAALLVRAGRYFLVSFADFGVYPLLFRRNIAAGKSARA